MRCPRFMQSCGASRADISAVNARITRCSRLLSFTKPTCGCKGQRNVDWANRAQFAGVAAKMMRRILLDHATAHQAQKRGAGAPRVSLDSALEVCERQEISAIRLNEALQGLEAIDPRQAQVVELRFFGGLTVPEIGELLSISPATVKREWTIAKVWLERELRAA